QEVDRLTVLNIKDGYKIADQISQINFLRTTQARVEDSGDQLLPKLLEACKERDQYKSQMRSYGDRYEQTLGDLMAARKDIHYKDQQLQRFNFENEDVPHLTEAAGLLDKTKEAYRHLEKKANECLFREQNIREGYARAEMSWKLGDERKQKQIDNLEAKIVLLENSNERLIDDLERRSEGTHDGFLNTSIPFQQEGGSTQFVSDLRSYVSRQEAQIAAQDTEIHQHKVTISLHSRLLEEKDSAIRHLREEKLDAESQIEEIQTKADEREIVAIQEMEKAVNDIDWLQTEHQNHQAQIHSMTERGLPVALIEIHQAEIQELQQYIVNLENEILTYRAQQQEQISKDWHDANAAALSERATEILRLNWENANEDVRELKNEIAILRQGGDPAKFEIVERLAAESEERQQIQEKLEKSDEKLERVVGDVLTLGRLAAVMWKSLEITWRRDRENNLLRTLGPVAEEVNEVVGRYTDGRVEDVCDGGEEVESTAEPELEDYVDDEEGLDQGLEGNSATAVQDTDAFQITPSAFRSLWASEVTNPFVSHPDQDPGEQSHRSERSSSHRPGIIFTAPSAPSSRTSTKAPSSSTPDNDSDLGALPRNQEHSAPPQNSTGSYDTISLTETNHRSFDPVSNSQYIDLERESTFTPNSPNPYYPEQHSLIIYNPIEEVEAELMTQSAYDLLFPLPSVTELGELAEWGHESFYAPPENYNTPHQETRDEHTEVVLEDYEDDAEKEWREAHEPYTEEELDEMLASFSCGGEDREGDAGMEVEGEDYSEEDGGCAL
ncbi:MAG: hypothetical protein Q9180_005960, partial [Flavoplaca navasiana]